MSNPQTSRPSLLRHVPTVVRILMGLAFFTFGGLGLFHPMSPPPGMPANAMAFSAALQATGYMMPLIFGTQVLVGALLLLNRFVPLALAMITPFLVNSLAFHIFLETSGLPMASLFGFLNLYLAWSYRKAFAPMLSWKTQR